MSSEWEGGRWEERQEYLVQDATSGIGDRSSRCSGSCTWNTRNQASSVILRTALETKESGSTACQLGLREALSRYDRLLLLLSAGVCISKYQESISLRSSTGNILA